MYVAVVSPKLVNRRVRKFVSVVFLLLFLFTFSLRICILWTTPRLLWELKHFTLFVFSVEVIFELEVGLINS